MSDLADLDDVGLSEEAGKEVVFELDLYAGGSGVLGKPTTQGYVLQFPLRSIDRPYEDPTRVMLKSKVKRMQWDIPLAVNENYNQSAASSVKMRQFTLQSSRVDPGMQGLAVGVRHDNAVYLVPVSEVLQLRHSLAYLDKEKEKEKEKEREKEARKAGASGSNGAGSGSVTIKQEERPTELLPITVQVKKHETEQQTEARLRSYAFHAQQEEADPWIDLKFKPGESEEAANILEKVPEVAQGCPAVATFHSPQTYLDAIAPGSASTAVMMEIDGEGAIDANGNDLGRPAGELGGPVRHGTGQLSPDALAALPSQLAAFFQASPVLSLESIRLLLVNIPSHGVLNRAGQTASDAALHQAIMSSGNYICIRKSYTPRVANNPAIDPLRSAVLELLQDKEQVKRADVMDAAQGRHIACTDAMYHRVMKELCTSRGSIWTLKTGS